MSTVQVEERPAVRSSQERPAASGSLEGRRAREKKGVKKKPEQHLTGQSNLRCTPGKNVNVWISLAHEEISSNE